MAAQGLRCSSKCLKRPTLEVLAIGDSVYQCHPPSSSRSMATEVQLPPSAIDNPYTPTLSRRPPPPIADVLATVYRFPEMEPLRFTKYPANHLHLPLRRDILQRAVVYEADIDRGMRTANTKYRSEVHGSNRKIRPQKGTGHARLGNKKSPMLRGGGVAFGPKPRDMSTKLPRKIYDLAWRTALSYRYRRGELIVVQKIEDIEMEESRWIEKIMEWNHWGKPDGRSLIVTRRVMPTLFEALNGSKLGQPGAGQHGKVKEEADIGVKDLLELGRVVIEKRSLDSILKNHSSDLNMVVPSAIATTSDSSIPSEQPGDDPDDVLFNTFYGVRTIELNRPKKLNSLNASMARKIIPRLLEWQKSQLASVIIIGGAGSKAFCAGGDVAALAKQNTNGPEGREASHAYFGLEYQLDHLIATYPKPYIAYMDGITMGGGVGLSVHAPIRIATERTLFAMPETTIGFFPDVGGSFFLPRLEGQIGNYLALTSERLKGVNAFYAGVATHYIDSSTLTSLTARLAEIEFKDYENMHSRLATINATIAEFDTGLPHDEPMLLAGELRKAIDRCFRCPSVEEIISALEHEESNKENASKIREWATSTLNTLSERSPTSLKVALKASQEGRNWNIAEAFQREYHIAGHFMSHPDFGTGVSARLINKTPTNPVWNPPRLEDVSEEQVANFFRSEGDKRMKLLGGQGQRLWKEYPFQMGLVREEEIEDLVKQGGLTTQAVIKQCISRSEGRVGTREKVAEVIDRQCRVDENGYLVWAPEEYGE